MLRHLGTSNWTPYFENFTLDDINTYGIDIINEVQEDKIRDSFNDQYSEIIVTVSNNILRDIINVTNGNEKTEFFEPVFLLLTVNYYKYHHFIFKLSEKEQTLLSELAKAKAEQTRIALQVAYKNLNKGK